MPDAAFVGSYRPLNPLKWLRNPVIESLLDSGYHVVAVGGGGIPVVRTDKGLEGVDAVIDKDLASACWPVNWVPVC